MGTYATNAWTSSAPCPHSDGTGTPVCWDCAEGGHVYTPTVDWDSQSWQSFKKFRRSFGLGSHRYSRSNVSAVSQVSTLEVRPPEGGLEVGSPLSRRSQPGLILVEGPRVVSPEEKFIKPELKSWDSESTLKDEPELQTNVLLEVTAKKEKSWGLQRRTFYILIVVAILTFTGVIIGIAVAVTQQNRSHPTSLSATGGGQVSSSSSPMPSVVATKTVSYYVAGASSTLVTLSETDIHSSSRQVGSVMALTGTTTTATGKGGEEPTIIAVTSTAFVVVAQQPPPTNKIPLQPVTTTVIAPPPAKTSTASPPAASSYSSRICLGDDGSTYTDPGTGHRFRIECAVAHQGKDIMNLEAETMQECISLCAKNRFCKGAIWFNVGPQGTDLNYCWLKSALDDNNVQDTPDAQSVVLL